jgi:zinc D-Ala-D-Ala dipeptidase
MQAGRSIKIEGTKRHDREMHGHSLDRTAGAVRQGDVDAAQVERSRQAFARIGRPPAVDAGLGGKASEHHRIGQGFLSGSIDAGVDQSLRQGGSVAADDQASPTVEARRKRERRSDEWRSVAFADGAEPIAQTAVDGRYRQPAIGLCLREQDRCGGNAGQWHGKTDRQAARGGKPHAHAGKAAGAHRHGDQRKLPTIDAGIAKDGFDGGQQARRLITTLLGKTGKSHAITHHGQAHAADGAIEGEDRHVYSGFMNLDLVSIAPPDFDVDVTLAYATEANLTGQPVYRNAECWLHRAAAEKLAAAIALARPLGLRLRIFDALRPVEAQWALWNVRPDPEFLADPRRGSPHSRGVAVDLTLLDGERELDMGTGFDAFTPLSHHGRTDVPVEAQRNRLLLMGLMTSAGWDFYRNEWWHYQLFDQRRYPLVSDADLPRPMM